MSTLQNTQNIRKIIVLSFISLDGVMQAPGGPEEDSSGGFQYGGWSVPYGDEALGRVMQKQMQPADLLLGRKTFDIFESYWPKHTESWPSINEVTKYVLSNTKTSSEWQNTVFINSLVDIKALKNSEGSDIKVWGSGKLTQLLLENDLVDELYLKIYPLTLGAGKKLFDTSTISANFELIESTVTSTGVIIANYKRAGKVVTGTY